MSIHQRGGRQSQYPWEIFCWPGPKAKEEMKRAREVLQPQLFQNQLTDPQQSLLEAIRKFSLLKRVIS
jgi:hypothetical protein